MESSSSSDRRALLRMVAGLETVTAGTVAIDGRVVNGVEPKDRDIAMVFQNYALYPHMTVYENMSFGLRLKRYPREEIARRVQEAARILDIAELLDRKPRQLSGGQRQRVAMGRAIVRNPKVFLFDEPLSNLDAKLRVQMRTEIKRVHQKVRTTTVYVTHDQVEAMTLADRVVVMSRGRIEQIGSPNELYHAPKTRFVAGFIGSPAMNLLPCRLEQAGGALRVRLSQDIASGAVGAGRTLPRLRRTRGSDFRPAPGTSDRREGQWRRAAGRHRCAHRSRRAAGDGNAGLLSHRRTRRVCTGEPERRRARRCAHAPLRRSRQYAPDRRRHWRGDLAEARSPPREPVASPFQFKVKAVSLAGLSRACS